MTVRVTGEAGPHQAAVDDLIAAWAADGFATRLWEKDPTLWSAEPVAELADRLGWLDLPGRMNALIPDLESFGSEIAGRGFRHVVVLGMGGSSLAPEVFQAVLGNRPSHPELRVLDSTHPGAVQALAERITHTNTLFVVSSKSGTTLETLAFFRYFWNRVAADMESPGENFIAVTDPGSALEALATDRGFRRIFNAPSDVGGRYSALTEFGLVPAAVIGADLTSLAEGARKAVLSCGPEVAVAENPGLALGAFLGTLAAAGRNKATFLAAPRLRPLVPWIEQLVAESTGKDQRGILPVGGDDGATKFGSDRAFVAIELGDDALEAEVAALENSGHPVARLRLDRVSDLGGAMFVLEIAVAATGAALGIHPFNQPDVQLAKGLARRAMDGDLDTAGVAPRNALDPGLAEHVRKWLDGITAPEYVGIHAYLPPTVATRAALETARSAIRDGRRVAATYDFGPRFLHSTGQLHKGGPPVGRFLQVTDRPHPHLDVPESDFSFQKLIGAQALGDYQALRARGQRVLRVSLGDTGAEGLEAVVGAVVDASQVH